MSVLRQSDRKTRTYWTRSSYQCFAPVILWTDTLSYCCTILYRNFFKYTYAYIYFPKYLLISRMYTRAYRINQDVSKFGVCTVLVVGKNITASQRCRATYKTQNNLCRLEIFPHLEYEYCSRSHCAYDKRGKEKPNPEIRPLWSGKFECRSKLALGHFCCFCDSNYAFTEIVRKQKLITFLASLTTMSQATGHHYAKSTFKVTKIWLQH